MKTPTLENLRKTPHWSASSLNTFLVCSLQWAFRYVYGREPCFVPAGLVFGGVFHKAFVAVDEQGTEAAAASAVIMQLESVMETDISLIVDRPFLFLIRHLSSGAILFMGRMVDPAQ